MRVVYDADPDPEEEIVEGELVLSADPPGQGLEWARTPAVQSAVAAATGFVAGAATLALMRRYGRGRLERALGSGAGERLPSPGAPLGPGRTYIVHVRPLHTIGPPGMSGE